MTVAFFSLSSHTLRACEARALRARKTLTPHFTALLISLLILRKKKRKRMFCSLVLTRVFKQYFERNSTTMTLKSSKIVYLKYV